MSNATIDFVTDDAVSAVDVAQKLAAPARNAFEQDGDLSKTESELESLWSSVLEAAGKTSEPQQQGKLVDIMRAIKTMPQPVREGAKLIVRGQEERWDQLPLFGSQAREHLDIAKAKVGGTFVNMNAFFARLTAADVHDLGLFAIWVLREALEDPDESEVASRTSSELAQAASVWLLYAADTLARLSREGKQFEGKKAKPGQALVKSAEWTGFCDERWSVWLSRLATLRDAQLPTETKTLINQALEKAHKI